MAAGNMHQKDLQIADLHAALEMVLSLSADALATQILDIGFKCLGCGECCSGEDNSVVVFPVEARVIQAATGLEWLEVVRPPDAGEWDRDGRFHTLEWRLKKEGESCQFFENGKCSIYPSRPALCSTYPFYLDEGVLQYSLCRGIGGVIGPAEAKELAERVRRRSVLELKEAIALTEKFEDFERGKPNKGGDYVVHDSEGEHRISGARINPDCNQID
jgi:Fe-S-cluster containining protein